MVNLRDLIFIFIGGNMALISCTECGKEISSKAKTCPQCGCPVSIKQKILKNEQRLISLKYAYTITILLSISLLGYFFISQHIFDYYKFSKR